jgi:hypothetical protein
VQSPKRYKGFKISLKTVISVFAFAGTVWVITPAVAQVKVPFSPKFSKDLTEANLTFTLPAGFKEIKPANNNDGFDYAIEMPDASFEIWFLARSLKDNRPVRIKNDKAVNPDSAFVEMGRTQAEDYVGGKNYLSRRIPPTQLERYGADAGRTYLVNLPDSPDTKHYKYAMIVVLQKNHVGMLDAVCFANELGPGFFKNLNSAANCIKFNP